MLIFVKVFLLSCCASVAYSGGFSHCEPFFTNYHEFLQNFLQSVEQRKQAIISDVQNFSFYENASVVEAQLTSDNYYTFFINVTAQLSELTTETVEGVLNGTITAVPDPLGCVDGSFDIVKQVLHDLRNKVLNVGIELSSSSSPSSSPSTNCTDASELFPLYSSQLQQILNKRNQLNELDAQNFAKFQSSIIALNIAQNENQFLYMVTALADALHIDVAFAKEIVSGHVFDG
ncbi:hypothetical protein ACKWTF_014099 [Chironomus riparius]